MTFDINDKTAIITYEGSDTIGRPFRDEIIAQLQIFFFSEYYYRFELR